MRRIDQFLCYLRVQTAKADRQRHVQTKPGAVGARSDADRGGYTAFIRQLVLEATGDEAQGAQKAGRIAGGE